MKTGKITYVGWLGHGNVGDDALYRVSQAIFEQYEFLPYSSGRCSRITLFGGGTFLPPGWPIRVQPNKYNYAFGVGVRSPEFWGNFDPIFVTGIKRYNFRLLGVRGNLSKELLKQWGIDSEVIGDPCLLLEPSLYEKRENTMVAVNCARAPLIWGRDEERVLRETIKLCKLLKKEGYHPILTPFFENDVYFIDRISNKADVDVFENWADIQHLLDFISSCKILIGEKLHSLVFSASTHTPFISLEYRPKCLDFAESMGFAKYAIRTDTMTADKVMTMFHNLLDNWHEMHRGLTSSVELYRNRLRDFAGQIMKDIESLPDDKWSNPRPLEKIACRIVDGTDTFLYNHVNSFWRAWSRTPVGEYAKCLRDFLLFR